jgi:GTPase SAR1 family protein
MAKGKREIPVGFNLLKTLREFDKITRFAWSPDGKILAIPSYDNRIHLWDIDTGQVRRVLKGHREIVFDVAWSPDGQTLASGAKDGSCKLWNVETGALRQTFVDDLLSSVGRVAWSPTERVVASGSNDGVIRLWDCKSGELSKKYKVGEAPVVSMAWSPNGQVIASTSEVNTVNLWHVEKHESLRELREQMGLVYSLAWFPDTLTLVTGSNDSTIRLWNIESGKQIGVIEGHTKHITNLSFSSDGHYLASKSTDGTVRIWRCENWNTIGILPERSYSWTSSASFNPKSNFIVTYDEGGPEIRIWELDFDILNATPVEASVHYATAKIALVGDSGVGKTGLGWRLAHGQFKEHPSTHGQQFWVIDELGGKRADETECEAVLWDFAGQPDYRIVHSLFLDDVDLALVLFDPANREKPLSGVEFWLKQLSRRKDHPSNSILVGARIDRGAPIFTSNELDNYCEQHGISGGYVGTSAVTGDGLPELTQKIKSQIPWEEMPATVTTATFKRIKEYVLSLKESGEKTNLLVSPEELRLRLHETDKNWEFTRDEMMTAVRHLETHGYVSFLRSSSGKESILLFPDVLVNLASSFVLEARRNPMGLGVLEEERLLHGGYSFPEIINLNSTERETLLDAVAALFLKNNLCFRETFNELTFLVFPSLINEKRPRIENIESFDDVSYRITGAVENIYAALVVLLGYTNTFTRKHQWQNQAQYELGEDEICGFRQVAEHEGEIELVLYYGVQTPPEVYSLFQGLFERFLKRRDVLITRFPAVICSNCGKRQERSVVMNQIQEGLDTLFCNKCGTKMGISMKDELTTLPSHTQEMLDQEQAVARRRTAFEEALVWIKSILRMRGDETLRPSCFISYAWGSTFQERWVLTLAKDLRNAGIDVIFDRWHNTPGTSVVKFIERIESSDYVIAIGTLEYLEKYNTESADPVVDAEIRLIGTRLRKRTEEHVRIIPLLLAGEQLTSFPPLFHDSVYINFVDEENYFINLLNLILTLYSIPFDIPYLDNLKNSMRSSFLM